MTYCDIEMRTELNRRNQKTNLTDCGKPIASEVAVPPRFYSVYFSDSRAAGWSIGEGTQEIADENAKNQCKEQAGIGDRETCKRLIAGRDLCIAIATSSNGSVGAASGKSIDAARTKAIKICTSSGGEECEAPPLNAMCH